MSRGDAQPDRAAATRRRTGPNTLLALPALGFFAVFALVPLVGVVLLSLTSWDGLGDPPGRA